MAVQDRTTLKSYFNGSPVPSVPKISQYEDLIDSMQLVGSENVSNTNLNNLTESGFYVGDNLTNAPSVNGYYIKVIKHNSNYILQELVNWYSAGSPQKFIRRLVNGTWDSWVNIYPATDADTLDGVHASGFHKNTESIQTDYDIFIKSDEIGIRKRFDAIRDPDEHFEVSARPSGWSKYGTHNDTYTVGSNLYLTGGTGNTFLYKTLTDSNNYFAGVSLSTLTSGSTIGVRIENGSDTTYYVQYVVMYAGSYTWRIMVEYRNGSGDSNQQVYGVLLTGYPMPIHLQMNITGTKWSNWGVNGLLRNMNAPSYMASPNNAVSGLTWTPTRMGIKVYGNGGTGEDFYCDYFSTV